MASTSNTSSHTQVEEFAASTSTSGGSTMPMKELPRVLFINHGPDVKHTLVSAMYERLNANGLKVFINSEELELGDQELDAAIKSASLYFAIFSEDYGQSKWCLEELSFMDRRGTKIVPIFCHVKPEDVRYTKGVYADAFDQYKKKCRHTSEKLLEWNEALYIVSHNIGHIFNNKEEVSIVGVHCMGGSNDLQIKDDFDNNVIFITASQSPNLKGILQTMWEKIDGRKRPEFEDVEDAHIVLQQLLSRQYKLPVWSMKILEKLLFEGPQYKTLITTKVKSTIPRTPYTQLYHLPLLGTEDALSPFCSWALGQASIPSDVDANLLKELQAECDGLPLALKVTRSSMHGEPHEVWKRANKISKRDHIPDYHRRGLFRLLQTSIDSLDDAAMECFLDLGLFPGGKKTCADALLDIWVYVRKLQRHDAFAILSELASRNLLNLTSNSRGSTTIPYGNASELYFSQHDVMRDLALYLGHRDNMVCSKRLVITRKDCSLLAKWEQLNVRAFDTQILSIVTGPIEENHWYDMNFPETEALLLLFSSTDYILPPFLKSMTKLKFLMVSNCDTKKATIKGLDVLSSLTQLKSVRLEKLISPLVAKQSIEALQNIEKVSLSLCEGFGNISTFTNLQDFNLDHSSDLEELPLGVCNVPSAMSWSITNCHQLQNLPYDFGNMSYLRMLRLSALPRLKELPASIGKLGQLEYLDISVCEGLKELPKEIGQLKKLREFDMRECSRLTRLPTTVCELSSLKLVTCDEKIGKQWLRTKNISIPKLRVEIVEAHFCLDWLDD